MRERARRFFIAFQSPGYPFIAASGLAFSAGWTIEALCQGWLVLQLTDSPFWVGAAAGIRGTSQILFGLVGGTVADRFDRRRILWAAFTTHAVACLALAAAVLAGPPPLALVLALVSLSGVSGAVSPSMQAIVYDVVGPTRLLNAGAFSFLAGAVVRTAAGIVTGLILDRYGIAPGYALAAVALTVASLVLFPLHARHRRPSDAASHEPPLAALRAVVRYARHHTQIRDLLVLSIVTEAFGFAYLFVMPVLARDILHAGATGLGALTAASATGQFVAMIGLAASGDVRRKGALLVASTAAFGIAVAALAVSPVLVLSIAFALCAGASGSLYDTSIATLVQLTTSREMRGRVLGLYVATYGMSQVGGFIVGAAATVLTVPVALALAGAAVAANAARCVPTIARLDPARHR